MIRKIDKQNKFISIFNPKSGFYVRSGIIEDGKDTGKDPFMAAFPELVDVGIMGHCTHGKSGLCIHSGVECYQNGPNIIESDMNLTDFQRIAKECRGRSFQFALGGRGDPDQHEKFEEILKSCIDNQIVPNFTSSGLGFSEETVKLCKKYCGAVAISWYRSDYTRRAIDMLLKANVKTNIHYVLGNNSIDEATERLRKRDFPEGINAVIFLLHKPIGLGTKQNVLYWEDKKVKDFFELVDKGTFPFKIGFDSCSIPGLINYTKRISRESFDTCEGARWSAYITADMHMLPCSFDNQAMKWAYDISEDTIEHAWNSSQFQDFRKQFQDSCPECMDRTECRGGCPISRDIVLCNRKS